jgi:periplasmic copper chaperone A
MRLALVLTALALPLAACQPAPKALTVDDAHVRLPAVSGNPGAGYFTVKGGPSDDRLMSVASPLAIRSEMHDMVMRGGAMAMVPIEAGVAVGKGAELRFESGGKHVMLFDISPKVTAGGKMPLELRFASGAVVKADAAVIAAGDDAPHAH